MMITLLTSFAISAIIIPYLINLSHRKQWYDTIDERKIHTENTPRIGGIGIFWGFMISLSVVLSLGFIPLQFINREVVNKIVIVLFSCSIVHVVGLLDDFKNLKARFKFFVQFCVAIAMVCLGFSFKEIHIPFTSITFTSLYVTVPISILWLVGIPNAINLIDGIDGLCSVVSVTSASTICLICMITKDYISAVICFALIGSVIGFFAYNKPKAKIFMGDSGSLVIGFLLALLPIIHSTTAQHLVFESSITILLVPIADTLFAMGRRMYKGVSIATPDKEHFHHILLGLGLSNWGILGVVLFFSGVIGVVPISYLMFPNHYVMISGVMAIIWVLGIFILYRIHRRWRLTVRK